MSDGAIVSNSSPLISFERIQRLELLSLLFGQVLIPRGVLNEVGAGVARLPWLAVRSLQRPIPTRLSQAGLGAGETEAIALALEVAARWVLLDDEQARRLARQISLPAIGTVGLLLAAKRRALLESVRPILDALIAVDFRISPDLYANVLIEAGED